jgi:hypothetical protein
MWIRRDDGQALVYVALGMVVLLLFVALAVDVGAAYSQRRLMQNAADAAALAGAYEICFGTPANAISTAATYATVRNTAQSADVTLPADWKVQVVAHTAASTYFARVIGINTIPVSAEAIAVCGKAQSACGLWPITFNKGVYEANKSCGQEFLLWEEGKATCTECNCDVDKDGVDEALPLDDRAWADFTAIMSDKGSDPCDSSGCSNSELKDRISGSTKGGEACRSFIKLNSCMVGDSGVRSSTWSDAGNEAGEIKKIPLYDSKGCTMAPGSDGTCGNQRYWVSTFGCIQVLGSYRLEDKYPKASCNKAKVIHVKIPCDADGKSPPQCASTCGTAGDTPPGPGDVKAVSLIK